MRSCMLLYLVVHTVSTDFKGLSYFFKWMAGPVLFLKLTPGYLAKKLYFDVTHFHHRVHIKPRQKSYQEPDEWKSKISNS